MSVWGQLEQTECVGVACYATTCMPCRADAFWNSDECRRRILDVLRAADEAPPERIPWLTPRLEDLRVELERRLR